MGTAGDGTATPRTGSKYGHLPRDKNGGEIPKKAVGNDLMPSATTEEGVDKDKLAKSHISFVDSGKQGFVKKTGFVPTDMVKTIPDGVD